MDGTLKKVSTEAVRIPQGKTHENDGRKERQKN
jgi:hypothetical protein